MVTTPEALRARLDRHLLDEGLPVMAEIAPAVVMLRPGMTISVKGSTWLAMALAAGPSAGGSWTMVVGMPSLGVMAAAEVGMVLGRLALVEVDTGQWVTAVAAAIDSVDVVIAGVPSGLEPAAARRLSARARERRSLLIVVERPGAVATGPAWPERFDLGLEVKRWCWSGLDNGSGHLISRSTRVEISGRQAGGRQRQVDLVRSDSGLVCSDSGQVSKQLFSDQRSA